MPVVKENASLPVRTADGVTETLVAGAEVFGAPVPLRLRRVALEPGRLAAVDAAGAEVMAYVLEGSGVLTAAGEQHALETESMAWVEPPEAFELEAGSRGLVILVAEAPPAGIGQQGQ